MIDFEIIGKALSKGSLILLIAFFVFSLFGASKIFEKLIDFCFTKLKAGSYRVSEGNSV